MEAQSEEAALAEDTLRAAAAADSQRLEQTVQAMRDEMQSLADSHAAEITRLQTDHNLECGQYRDMIQTLREQLEAATPEARHG